MRKVLPSLGTSQPDPCEMLVSFKDVGRIMEMITEDTTHLEWLQTSPSIQAGKPPSQG